jgi:hypothetical protein
MSAKRYSEDQIVMNWVRDKFIPLSAIAFFRNVRG